MKYIILNKEIEMMELEKEYEGLLTPKGMEKFIEFTTPLIEGYLKEKGYKKLFISSRKNREIVKEALYQTVLGNFHNLFKLMENLDDEIIDD